MRKKLALSMTVASLNVLAQSLPAEVNFQSVTRQGATIYASGTQGSVYRSDDNGANWQPIALPSDAASLQIRDIAITGEQKLLAMSAGEGNQSRLYYSADAGANWQTVLSGSEYSFFDCVDFHGAQGWLYGDSDEQGLAVYHSSDAGLSWQRQTQLPDALVHEGGFASSGTCVDSQSAGDVLVGTGNGPTSRLLMRFEGVWQAIDTPLGGGEASGVFSVHKRNDQVLVAGGSLKTPQQATKVYIYHLADKRWQALDDVPLNGAVYGTAMDARGWYISNPEGIARWDGQQWHKISDNNTWSMACGETDCIGVGAKGSVTRF